MALLSCVIKSLVFQLDAVNFLLDFHLPFTIFDLSAFVVFILKFSNLFKLLLFFNFKSCLINRLWEKDIQNRLDFFVIVEKVVVFDLCDLVNTCFLWDIWWSWGFRLELVSLQFHFCLVWLRFALFRKEVGQVNFNPSWGPRSQVIWRGSIFRFLEFHELAFDHFNLLPFSLFFDSLVLLLLRS